MARPKTVINYVVVSDTSKPVEEQEGILLTIEGRGGDTEKNRDKALEVATKMWGNSEIDEDKFPNGISLANIIYVPPESANEAVKITGDGELLPIVQGAKEIIELTRLQIEVQEAAEEVAPYVPIIEAVLERGRPLTSEEKEVAKEKKYGKTIERLGVAIASQEEYQVTCTGNGKLILNALAWQLSQNPKIASILGTKEEE